MKAKNPQQRTISRRELLAMLAALGVGSEGRAQDPSRAEPRSYKVVLENDRVRVLEYHSRPGMGVCGRGMHYHPAHVTMTLTPGKVKVTLPDGKSQVKDAPAGTVFFAPEETHSVENVGGSGTRAYIVELKGPDWKPSTG
jgi:hypothetical protein